MKRARPNDAVGLQSTSLVPVPLFVPRTSCTDPPSAAAVAAMSANRDRLAAARANWDNPCFCCYQATHFSFQCTGVCPLCAGRLHGWTNCYASRSTAFATPELRLAQTRYLQDHPGQHSVHFLAACFPTLPFRLQKLLNDGPFSACFPAPAAMPAPPPPPQAPPGAPQGGANNASGAGPTYTIILNVPVGATAFTFNMGLAAGAGGAVVATPPPPLTAVAPAPQLQHAAPAPALAGLYHAAEAAEREALVVVRTDEGAPPQRAATPPAPPAAAPPGSLSQAAIMPTDTPPSTQMDTSATQKHVVLPPDPMPNPIALSPPAVRPGPLLAPPPQPLAPRPPPAPPPPPPSPPAQWSYAVLSALLKEVTNAGATGSVFGAPNGSDILVFTSFLKKLKPADTSPAYAIAWYLQLLKARCPAYYVAGNNARNGKQKPADLAQFLGNWLQTDRFSEATLGFAFERCIGDAEYRGLIPLARCAQLRVHVRGRSYS